LIKAVSVEYLLYRVVQANLIVTQLNRKLWSRLLRICAQPQTRLHLRVLSASRHSAIYR